MSSPAPRHPSLDAMRGLAVMGILIINIVSFAMPGDAYINPLVWGGWDVGDRIVWVVNQMVFDGRMRGLFALMFGAGMLLVMDRAEAAGASPVATHLRRMAVLLLFGLAHNYLVWDGDVLVHYAVIGSIVWVARTWSAKGLARAGVIVLLLHTLWQAMPLAALFYLKAQAAAPGASAEDIESFRQIMAAFPHPGSAGTMRELAVYTGGYADIVRFRLGEHMLHPWILLMYIGGETLGYMLIGMALLRSGFFTGGWPRAALTATVACGYAIGLPALAALTWWAFASGFDPIVLMGNFLAWSIPFRVATALAHAALAMLLLERFGRHAAVARIAAVGRMAFTNYLMTSLVMTTIFYGYGLALFGQVGRAELWLFVAAMWLAMLAWSPPWLAAFRFGPFEWLWRSIARGSPQPMRNAWTPPPRVPREGA